MEAEGRRRRWGVAAVAIAVIALVVAIARAPDWLRTMDAFAVERVQVEGTRYLAPHEALERSGIESGSNVFDDPRPWIDALLEHPLVADARIERQLPGTLVLTITEVEPVVLAPTPGLLPVDRHGRVLPIDPARASLDLPLLDVAPGLDEDGQLADTTALWLIGELERLRRLAPEFAGRVSEIGARGEGAIWVALREPAGATVLLPTEAGMDRLGQLARTLEELSRRGELSRVRGIDVRYRDQVVVSWKP